MRRAQQAAKVAPESPELQEARVTAETHAQDAEKKHRDLQSQSIAMEHEMAKVEQMVAMIKDEMLAAQYKGPSLEQLANLNLRLAVARNEHAAEKAAYGQITEAADAETTGSLTQARMDAKQGNDRAGAAFGAI